MYPINTPTSHWSQFKAWLDSQSLVEGQDYTLVNNGDWTMINFASLAVHEDFARFGSTLHYG